MQIIVPMSGFGERFRRAGYTVPKALIQVDGQPIIAHVADLFPGEGDFLFICNKEHLDTPRYGMEETLRAIRPTGKVVGIAPHKLGPVNAVLQAREHVKLDQPVIINYCDFTCCWDYRRFQSHVTDTGCAGAIACYTGFHPHMLGSTNYAYVRLEGMRVVDIKEKQPFTENPTLEYASSGTYYFASGAMALEYFDRTVNRPELAINGEFYVSLAYTPMLEDGKLVVIHPVEHFMQWGTPQDLQEYMYWSDAFRQIAKGVPRGPRQRGTVMVPMAGLGQRFSQEGYSQPKPLVPVSGEPMVVRATLDLPVGVRYQFVLRQDLPGCTDVETLLRQRFPRCGIVSLEGPTDGQARTCLLGMDGIDPDKPLTIGACDNGALYDAEAYTALMDDPAIDVIVWVARGYPGARRRPHHYGWVEERAGRVIRVSVKVPLADPGRDPIVIGTFTFKRASDFMEAANRMIARDGRVNGEFYIDTCINDAVAQGRDCRILEIDHYLCWGTPDDLRTYEYWESCLHKWPTHPYQRGSQVNGAFIRERDF